MLRVFFCFLVAYFKNKNSIAYIMKFGFVYQVDMVF